MTLVNLEQQIKDLIDDRTIVAVVCDEIDKEHGYINYEVHFNDGATLSISIYLDGAVQIADQLKLKESNVHNSN